MPRKYAPRRPSVPTCCLHCGQTFLVKPSKLAAGSGKYCSRGCKYAHSKVPARERFWSKVRKTEACWLWLAATNPEGYGIFDHLMAHRFAYGDVVGPIPEKLWVLHRCDNPPCVNPAHLFLGTVQDNNADRQRKGRGRYPGPNRPAKGDRHGFVLHPERAPRGEANGNARVTEEQVRMIRRRYSEGNISQHGLAAETGISRGIINHILAGRNWKHVK